MRSSCRDTMHVLRKDENENHEWKRASIDLLELSILRLD